MDPDTTDPKPTPPLSPSFEPIGRPNLPGRHPQPPSEKQPCVSCSALTTHSQFNGGKCWRCFTLESSRRAAAQEVLDLQENMDAHVADALARMGLSAREQRAEWGKVPHLIRQAIPVDRLAPMIQGERPRHGWGLGSDTGTGKTMAVAAVLKGLVQRRLKWWAEEMPKRVEADPETARALGPMPILWLSWPDTVTFLRQHAVDGAAEDLLDRAERVRLLVLDDLGRERIKGTYLEDWAASQLDRVVNARYREERPMVWTSNLREEQLAGIYGAALVSRLMEDNPMTWIEGLPSQRLR